MSSVNGSPPIRMMACRRAVRAPPAGAGRQIEQLVLRQRLALRGGGAGERIKPYSNAGSSGSVTCAPPAENRSAPTSGVCTSAGARSALPFASQQHHVDTVLLPARQIGDSGSARRDVGRVRGQRDPQLRGVQAGLVGNDSSVWASAAAGRHQVDLGRRTTLRWPRLSLCITSPSSIQVKVCSAVCAGARPRAGRRPVQS